MCDGLKFGCHQGQGESTDENGDDDVDYLSRCGWRERVSVGKTGKSRKKHTFTRINEGGTELEGECVGGIDSEKHDPEGTSLPDSTLEVDDSGVLDTDVIKRMQRILRPKGVTCTNGGDDFLGDGTSFRNILEGLLHVL